MRLMKTVLTCGTLCTIASTAALAQASGSSMKPDAMQGQTMSKMGDSADKHAMPKKGDGMAKKSDGMAKKDGAMAKKGDAMSAMKDTAMHGMSKSGAKADKKGMMKHKAAADSGMKHDGMADSSKMMKKPKD